LEGQKPDPALNGGNLEFSFKYDIASIFNHFGMLDATGLAKKIGMNPSLLRQYKTGSPVRAGCNMVSILQYDTGSVG
jgi:hypothetical protein